MSRVKLTQECGQRWYRLHSWRACGVRFRVMDGARPVGIAFGPVMLFWRWGQ